jgi:type IV pilus assembly protein PilM
MRLPSRIPSLNLKAGLSLGRRSGPDVVGLDIQPGFVAAVQARVNGSVLAERAAIRPLAADTMRDGEVVDDQALGEVLHELFAESRLGKRVRVGVANQRTVLRTLELPPVTDEKELAAAVTFQAQDQVPMPLNNAVLDFHPLGVVDTPAGPRQRVVLVAAQRDMVERLLAAVRRAGLTPAGVDLSAFALIRSLHRHDPEQSGRVLYLNVDGLTNLAIAEGAVCRFTRVVGGGLEGMAGELAERRGIAIGEARALIASVDLSRPAPVAPAPAPEPVAAVPPQPAPEPTAEQPVPSPTPELPGPIAAEPLAPAAPVPPAPLAAPSEQPDDIYDYGLQGHPEAAVETAAASDADVWGVLDNGIREISGEVRNSLDFHRSQDGGGQVSHVVLSGAAEEIPGFADALSQALGVEVRTQTVGFVDERLAANVSMHRLAIATGLAVAEAPQ